MEEPVIEPGSLDKGQSRSCPGLIRALYSKTPIRGGVGKRVDGNGPPIESSRAILMPFPAQI